MNTLVFDIETVPDVEFGRRLFGLEGLSDDEVGKAMQAKARQDSGSDFLPHDQHRIVAISCAFRSRDGFRVWSLGDESASDEQLWHALDIAQGRQFVADMPEQLESEITQGGTNVSGGQRQRLAIARALVKRPDVYVFDDSFSALDFRTDARLRAALGRELGDATVIIVAQRVGTILHADRIVVLDEGEVAGIGTHDELMRTCETYREIVLSQVTEEEVA